MNFLAHSLFANQDHQIIAGQFCGDFVRGSNLGEFPEKIQLGILLHRQIDGYTDQHPVNLEAREFFNPPFRRFASILTDVVYDHYLARTWSLYSQVGLTQHIDLVHKSLENNFELLPLRLQRFARLLIDDDVLLAYLHFDAVEQALERISWRSPRFKLLGQAGTEISQRDEQLSDCFARFFPDLIQHVGKTHWNERNGTNSLSRHTGQRNWQNKATRSPI